MLNVKELEQKIREVNTLQIFTTDLNGRPVTLQVNAGNIESFFKKGVGFDGSSVPGYGTVENSDKLLIPLAETFRKVEFAKENLGFLIGKINEEYGERSPLDPRALLERVVKHAQEEFGFYFLTAPEHEFFLLTADEFSKDIHTDNAGYFQADPRDKGEAVRKEIVAILKKCGIQFEKMHHEVTPSQHEINLGCVDPLRAADRTVLFSYITKRVAYEKNLHATFMPKPFNGFNRNALHIHISAQDKNGNHLFYQPDTSDNLSETARRFIGGILKYARETSIVMAATFNSYKAYVVGKEAPIARGWGIKNRSSMVRIPYAEGAKDTRIEIRSPDPSGNIYMQIALLIGMGLQGVREKIDCGDPDNCNTYKTNHASRLMDTNFLPRNMFEALVEAENSRFLKEFLGEPLYSQYMLLKINEWENFRTFVTPREHKMNLNI
ncbi:MAG TPA: glutamine synthetase family protein [Desulfobacterales bacterium]|nr:glutamine synthetase family protein [Desulfobacterales bacterium]